MRRILVPLTLVAATAPLTAQVEYGVPGGLYIQSFDSLSNVGTTNAWTNNTTLLGWHLFTLANVAVTNYRADTGASNAGAVYSFGTSGSTERAIGGIGSSGFSGYIALALTNTSGLTLDSITLNFDGEQWRNGGNAATQAMNMEYGFGASFAAVSSWTAPGGNFNFLSPLASTTAASVDGNVAGFVDNLGGLISTSWLPGETLWIRWIDLNDAGNDHGLAIDNVQVSATVGAIPEPAHVAFGFGALALAGVMLRRRR